jgi:hypothetical protein
MACNWKCNILKRKLVIARQAVGRRRLLILIQGGRDALQLQSHARSARPRTILRGTVATNLAFATAIAGSHDLESFMPVVLVDENILFGVSARWRRGRSNRTCHADGLRTAGVREEVERECVFRASLAATFLFTAVGSWLVLRPCIPSNPRSVGDSDAT